MFIVFLDLASFVRPQIKVFTDMLKELLFTAEGISPRPTTDHQERVSKCIHCMEFTRYSKYYFSGVLKT